MPRFPYMNFPFPFYKTPSRVPPYYATTPQFNQTPCQSQANYTQQNQSNYTNQNLTPNESNYSPRNNITNNSQNPQCKDPRDFKQKNKSNKNDNYLFDLFGLKIYYDDVLLVSLIYFLYSEGVKDDGLFIVLILLLLS